ncbi:hypothetical protein BJ878DRAFT_265107 [Calycina marina]|uniref:DUF202 domain-containing protein n=1 Tax=Calycina marina TaxID=1763456 RepID=A0A9P7ZAY7_9HELO|nr:hypothetical protein BJ878DRAFT_265107 [Calycina marina]
MASSSASPSASASVASDRAAPRTKDSRAGAGFRSTKRDQRVDSVLVDARTRKMDMRDGSVGVSEEGASRAESSADEETVFVRRERERAVAAAGAGAGMMNYQSTNVVSRETGIERGAGCEGEGEGWWRRVVHEYGSIELENKGSVARDHLALERTFLAWVRTSLAFASIGIAITQLFRLNTTTAANGSDPYADLRQMGKPLGTTFLGISILMLGVGFHRYFEAQHWIIRGKFPASRGGVALVAAITAALVVASLVVVVVVQPGQFEKR